MNHGTTPLALPFSKKVGTLRFCVLTAVAYLFFCSVLAGVST